MHSSTTQWTRHSRRFCRGKKREGTKERDERRGEEKRREERGGDKNVCVVIEYGLFMAVVFLLSIGDR